MIEGNSNLPSTPTLWASFLGMDMALQQEMGICRVSQSELPLFGVLAQYRPFLIAVVSIFQDLCVDLGRLLGILHVLYLKATR